MRSRLRHYCYMPFAFNTNELLALPRHPALTFCWLWLPHTLHSITLWVHPQGSNTLIAQDNSPSPKSGANLEGLEVGI